METNITQVVEKYKKNNVIVKSLREISLRSLATTAIRKAITPEIVQCQKLATVSAISISVTTSLEADASV